MADGSALTHPCRTVSVRPGIICCVLLGISFFELVGNPFSCGIIHLPNGLGYSVLTWPLLVWVCVWVFCHLLWLLSHMCKSFLELKVQWGWGKGDPQAYLLLGDKSIGRSDGEVKQRIGHYCFHGFNWTLFVGLIIIVVVVKYGCKVQRQALDSLSFIHLGQVSCVSEIYAFIKYKFLHYMLV